MDYVCSIRGEKFTDREGLTWKQLRPSLQEFLKTVKSGWTDESFISYNALNDLLRAYVADMTSNEVKEHQILANRVEQRFAKDANLQPINPDLNGPTPTFGERLSDKIAEFGGSWPFIIIFFSILIVWMGINIYVFSNKGFDPYPFILLNLVLSCLAAVQAPIIMMSQNRQGEKDRERSEYDFKVNLKAETEVRMLHEKLDHLLLHQHKNMVEMFQLQIDMMQQLQQRWDALDNKLE